MSNDDTFLGSNNYGDRTVIRPRPGGRGFSGGMQGQQQPNPGNQNQSYQPERFLPTTHIGLNPLVDAATVLLFTAGQLQGTPSHPDPAGLRNQMNFEITTFENNARSFGVSPETIFTARYVLCTLLDEVVLSTP